jgi:hypothetical protein
MLFSALLTSGKTNTSEIAVNNQEAYGPVASVSESYPTDISVGLIDDFEGCTDTLVWPGYQSGPTIGCGIDLANIGIVNVKKIFSGVVEGNTYRTLLEATKVRGGKAESWSSRHQVRLTEHQVHVTKNRMLRIMWLYVESQFPGIDSAPGEIKTAVLSCAMNRGPYNKAILRLRPLVANKRYRELANVIQNMSNDHAERGLKLRRTREAELVRLVDSDASGKYD